LSVTHDKVPLSYCKQLNSQCARELFLEIQIPSSIYN
jgi:hypothetical protein